MPGVIDSEKSIRQQEVEETFYGLICFFRSNLGNDTIPFPSEKKSWAFSECCRQREFAEDVWKWRGSLFETMHIRKSLMPVPKSVVCVFLQAPRVP